MLRIGINLGDVIGEGSDIYGDGVNIAARLEALAEPGGICISAKVHEELRGKGDYAFDDLGEMELKNIARAGSDLPREFGHRRRLTRRRPRHLRAKLSIAVLPFTNMSGDPEPAIPFGRHHRGHHHRVVAVQEPLHRGASCFILSCQ